MTRQEMKVCLADENVPGLVDFLELVERELTSRGEDLAAELVAQARCTLQERHERLHPWRP